MRLRLRTWQAVGLLTAVGWHAHQPCTSLQYAIQGFIRAPTRRPLSLQEHHHRTPSAKLLSTLSSKANAAAAHGGATSSSRLKHATVSDGRNSSFGRSKFQLAAVTGVDDVETASGSNTAGPVGRVSLWLDMRTALLPAEQTLRALYNELRTKEQARGLTPDDPDWSLQRVPNPVGALLYASEPKERAARESQQLGGALPCYQVTAADGDYVEVLDVPGGNVVGVALDPVKGVGGDGMGAGAAAVAAAQRVEGSAVFLDGVRPSAWVDGDAVTVVRIAASACADSGKALVIAVRSVGQLHDAAIAALAASQTQTLGKANGEVGKTDGEIVLLIEPVAALWEAGLLYL